MRGQSPKQTALRTSYVYILIVLPTLDTKGWSNMAIKLTKDKAKKLSKKIIKHSEKYGIPLKNKK